MNWLKVTTTLLVVLCIFDSASAASRFWLGTTSDDWSVSANWSATSGGASGASVPTSADDVTFNSSGNNTCTITGDQEASSITISTGYTSTITMSSTSSLVVSNNFRIQDGTFSLSQGVIGSARRLDVNGNFQQTGGILNQHNFLNLSGNFIKTSGTYNSFTSATLIFDGAAQQQLTASGGLTVEYLQMNNSSEGLALNSDLTVEVSLDMTDGNIDLNSNKLTIGIDAVDVGDLTHTSGFISDGTVRRWFDGTSYTSTANNQIRFPFGIEATSDNSMWVGCTAAFTGGYVEATYTAGHDVFTAIAPTFVDNSITIDRRNNTVWTISSNTITTADNMTLIFRTIGISAIANISECRITGSNAAASGSHGSGSGDDISRTGIDESNLNTSYYLGGNSATNKLPVTLSYFNASMEANAVALRWETQTEINNERFELERSIDGINFEMIGSTPGAGTSMENVSYSYMDPSAFHLGSTKLFYRIKQIDFDGSATYSNIKDVDLTEGKAISWFPNPSQNVIRLSSTEGNVVIRNMDGKELIHSSGMDQVDISNLSSGMYIITFYDDFGTPVQQNQLVKR